MVGATVAVFGRPRLLVRFSWVDCVPHHTTSTHHTQSPPPFSLYRTLLDVTLSRVTQSGDPSPCVRDPCRDLACMCQTKRRPESIVHEHMSGREDRVPPVTLGLEDMRLRYDTYQVVATQPRMRRQSDDPQCAVPVGNTNESTSAERGERCVLSVRLNLKCGPGGVATVCAVVHSSCRHGY